jgi:hypothetical protein
MNILAVLHPRMKMVAGMKDRKHNGSAMMTPEISAIPCSSA